jgi:hypothetical protein
MRYLYILIVSLVVFSCNAKQKLLVEDKVENSLSLCPEGGTCTFDVLQNKTLEVKKDSFGALYPEIYDNDNIVLKFEYKRNEIPNTADSNYSELIYVELDPNNLILELEHSQLKTAKVLFARLCFCKGQTGYYAVDNGKLSITKESDNYQFDLAFKIDEVPQLISTINRSFTLKK